MEIYSSLSWVERGTDSQLHTNCDLYKNIRASKKNTGTVEFHLYFGLAWITSTKQEATGQGSFAIYAFIYRHTYLAILTFHLVLHIVQQLKPKNQANRSLCDTSTKFGVNNVLDLHFHKSTLATWKIQYGGHFSRWPTYQL